MNDKNPFEYPLMEYLEVIGVACTGGIIKHLNSAKRLFFWKFVIDILTSGFTGVLTFWCCESANVTGSTAAILIAVSGMMGMRALTELDNLWRAKVGLPVKTEDTKNER